MSMSKFSFIAAIILLILNCSHQSDFKYLGQKPPGNTPEIFAPGIISLDDRHESMITFSPDGKECYFTVSKNPWNDVQIMETVYQDSGWTTPEKASFINNVGFCPSISSDGKKLFFISSYKGTSAGVNLCERTADGSWSSPLEMDSLVNSGSNEYSVHPSNLGNIYVCSWRSGGVGGCDGWRIPYADGQYQKAENLGEINSVVGDCVWAPGPDEKFLIFQSRRPASGNRGGFFETDLFITFAMPDGKWSHPQNLGPQINSPETDGMAWVSHDGKYLFFSSNRRGTYDIYWVSLDSVLTNTPRIPLVAANHKPGEYEFYQLYKDASDSTTTVYFDLEKSGNVKLTICSRAGEKLGTVLNEFRQKGKNQFVWKGEGYKKGKYLCELEASDSKSGQRFMESTIQVLLKQ